MTDQNVRIATGRIPLRPRIDAFFLELGMGVNAYRLGRARLPQILALEAKSDRDLAHMGLAREDILPHVFGDLLDVGPARRA